MFNFRLIVCAGKPGSREMLTLPLCVDGYDYSCCYSNNQETRNYHSRPRDGFLLLHWVVFWGSTL